VRVFQHSYGLLYPAQDAHRMAPVFFRNYAILRVLEPLIGFLAYPDEKLCHKNQNVVKIPTPKKGNQGETKPLLYMAITRRQNRLESCSNPLKQCFSNGRDLAH